MVNFKNYNTMLLSATPPYANSPISSQETNCIGPLKIYSIKKILSVKSIEDGFLEVKIVLGGSLSNSDFENFIKDGWPIYVGEEEWAFISKKTPIYEKGIYESKAYLTIKTKNGLYLNQNFAFLNQQETNHYTNEEIISAVNDFNKELVYNNWKTAIDTDDLRCGTIDWAMSRDNKLYVGNSNDTSLCYVKSNDQKIDANAYYKGYELATVNDIDSVQEGIDLYRINQDFMENQINTLQTKLESIDTIVSDLSKEIGNFKNE